MNLIQLRKTSLLVIALFGLLPFSFSQSISLNPTSGTENTSFGVTVTGSGTNFLASSTTCVEIKSTPSSIFLTGVSVTSSTLLTGNLSIPLGTNAGTYDATVYQGSGCAGVEYDCTNCFTVNAATPAISSISPNTAEQGESLTGVTFTGINTNFTASTTCVEIMGSPSTITLTGVSVSSPTSLTANVSIPANAIAGSYGARIYEGPGCTGAVYTCSNCFTITAPAISFSPNSGTENTSFGVTVTGSGTNFYGSTTCVEIMASPSPIFLTGVNVTSATLLTGNLAIPIGTNAGTYDATVYRGPGCTGTEYDCAGCFTINAAPPAVTNISQNSAEPGQSLTGIAFTGINTNFTANTTCIEILASPATITLTSINVTSSTSLTANVMIPSGTTPGSYSTRIFEGPGCTGAVYACSNCFTITTPDIVPSPNTGDQGDSFTVTVTGNGTNFNSSTTCVEVLASPSTITLTGVNVTSSTLLDAIISIPFSTTIGTYDMRVFEGPGCAGNVYDCINCFTVDVGVPVELSYFEALKEEQHIALNWKTTSEINSAYFEVQRSRNGQNWQSLGRIEAAGNSNIEKTYQLFDRQPFAGNNLYRLRQTDLDGTSSFSEIRVVKWDIKGTEVYLSPNPVSDELQVNIVQDQPMELEVIISDITGKNLRRFPQGLQDTGLNTILLDLNSLKPGLYFLQIEMENGERKTSQFVKN